MESRQILEAGNLQTASMKIATRMLGQDCLLEFGGCTHNNLHIEIIESAERLLFEIGESTQIRKRVINAIIECLCNITFHAHKPASDEIPFFNTAIAISRSGKMYRVETTNLILQQRVKQLKEKLDTISKLNSDELAGLYQKTLKTTPQTGSPGAGLGFIQMALRSKQQIHYQFQKLDEGLQLFCFQVTIGQ